MHFAVVFDLFVTFGGNLGPVFQLEGVSRTFEILVLNEYTLKVLRVEPERGTAFQPLLVGVEVNVLEILVREIGGTFAVFDMDESIQRCDAA